MCKLDFLSNNKTNNRVEQDKWTPLLKGIQISMMLLQAHTRRSTVKMHGNQVNAVIFNAVWTLPCSRNSGILSYLCGLSCCSILKSGREINLPITFPVNIFMLSQPPSPVTQRDVFTWSILQVLNCSFLNLDSVNGFLKNLSTVCLSYNSIYKRLPVRNAIKVFFFVLAIHVLRNPHHLHHKVKSSPTESVIFE